MFWGLGSRVSILAMLVRHVGFHICSDAGVDGREKNTALARHWFRSPPHVGCLMAIPCGWYRDEEFGAS